MIEKELEDNDDDYLVGTEKWIFCYYYDLIYKMNFLLYFIIII